MATHFATHNYCVKTSTTSRERLPALVSVPSEGHVVDVSKPLDEIDAFLQSSTLIVNITSKDVDGFQRLLERIKASDIEAVLFVSSTSVYPARNKIVTEAIGEESPNHPLVIIENMFRQNAQFRTTVVRFSGLIGGSRHPGRFFRGGKTVKDPEANVNLIHLDDCINIIDRIVTGNVWGETFNACADTHPSKREFYAQAAAMAGRPPPDFEDGEGNAFKIIDNRKLKRVLSYEFQHPDLMAIQFNSPGEH